MNNSNVIQCDKVFNAIFDTREIEQFYFSSTFHQQIYSYVTLEQSRKLYEDMVIHCAGFLSSNHLDFFSTLAHGPQFVSEILLDLDSRNITIDKNSLNNVITELGLNLWSKLKVAGFIKDDMMCYVRELKQHMLLLTICF